jgi:hypothetical protein
VGGVVWGSLYALYICGICIIYIWSCIICVNC